MEDNKSLSEHIAELDKKTDWFYSDDFKLEEASENYKEAAELAKEIENYILNMKNEIEVFAEDFSKY